MAKTGTFRTADGTNTGAFSTGDWSLVATLSLIWGSSFLWIAIGLESFSAPAVAFLRLTLGAVVLAGFAPARRAVRRDAWLAILVIAVTGNAGPALLYALAQERLESSVAGMINAATPLAVLAVSIVMLKRSPGPLQVGGLIIGFIGVAAMAAPNIRGADAEPLGVVFLLLAVFGYGISSNIIVPLQQEYGAAAIILRALVLGAGLLAPWGLPDVVGSSPSGMSVVAMLILGVAGTGIARTILGTLAGRVGASRSSIVTYFVPVIAISLGVIFRDETIRLVELAGTTLILFGAYLTSRAQQS